MIAVIVISYLLIGTVAGVIVYTHEEYYGDPTEVLMGCATMAPSGLNTFTN